MMLKLCVVVFLGLILLWYDWNDLIIMVDLFYF